MDVRNYLVGHNMVSSGDLVIAAVSGGADSVCLLMLLQEMQKDFGYELEAVHVEHGIRGEESLKDAGFVENLCRERGISLRLFSVDVPAYAHEHAEGIEEAARRLRYEAFAQEANDKIKDGYAPEQIKIALAHHMQDQAETVLFRMARGTGVAGLAGMEPVRQDGRGFYYIRPLLDTARNEVEAYLAQHNQEYCTDTTNRDEDYARNRIRARVIPELAKVNVQSVRHIAQTAEMAAEQQDYIEEMAQQELTSIAERKFAETGSSVKQDSGCKVQSRCAAGIDKISLEIEMLAHLHPALQKEVLRQALCEVSGCQKDLTFGHIQQLTELMNKTSGSCISLPYGVEAAREFDRLVLYRKKSGSKAECRENSNCCNSSKFRKLTEYAQTGQNITCGKEIEVSSAQIQKWKESGEEAILQLSETEMLVISIMPESAKNVSDFRKKTYTKSLDYDNIKDGFTIRRRKPGDYFYMKDGHRKKLKQYLIEKKIPVSVRQKLWLIAVGSQILWVAGIPFVNCCGGGQPDKGFVEVKYLNCCLQ